MWISYSDSEVNKFHPICEKALKKALELLGKTKKYQVLHHEYTGPLEMDFAIQNKDTGKYLCVIEVKRTPADVHSARYQLQAMSYVQMNASESEKPFYILTNLEYAFSFRYDKNRQRVFQQMLKPGLSNIGNFENDPKEIFIDKLAQYFKERINEYCENNYDYLITLEEFAEHMEQIKDKPKKWKSHLAVLLYEYIRGAFTFIHRNDLPDIRLFHNDVSRICNEAARVNFKDIFTYSPDKFEDSILIDNDTLIDLYDFGNQNVNGDSIAGILHAIVSAGHEHDGEVPTDLELARFVTMLAEHSSGELGPDELVCDPAAGSGNLISTVIKTYNLKPSQIIANDVNVKLLELLSLRLGLNYAKTINKSNSPKIYNKNIADFDDTLFEKIKVVVMNPPFSAGINCLNRKQPLYERIKALTGTDAKTSIGQMPLEAVFLELVLSLVKTGTTIACVFPKTHLLGRGIESKVIRQMLINQFGLSLVFNYPGEEIFDEVVKDTCILLGKKGERVDKVKIISSYDKIPNLDMHRFSQALSSNLTNSFQAIMPGIVGKVISTTELKKSTDSGWRMLTSEMEKATSFIRNTFKNEERFSELLELHYPMKRGNAGNNGGSDMLFFNSREELYGQFKGERIKFAIGMRNAKLDSFYIGEGDSMFLDASNNDSGIICKIIDAYRTLPKREGSQPRRQKNRRDWMNILNKESRKEVEGNSILIPRAIRTRGRIYLTKNPVFVSTNFVVITLPSLEKAVLVATWMSTVFYQLICEVSSKDQEGMRKMEVTDIGHTFVPDFDVISLETIEKLMNVSSQIVFLNLKNPQIREVDLIWAKELFKDEADRILETAIQLLAYLANKRNPGRN